MASIPKHLAPVSLTCNTANQLSATAIYASSIILEAPASNTSNIFFGTASCSSSNGIAMSAGQKLTWAYDKAIGVNNKIDLSKIYLDTDVTGNRVKCVYIEWQGS